jgi:hypothetical protein
MSDVTGLLDELSARMLMVEVVLDKLIEQRSEKEWYSTAEAARVLGKAEFTVREWCRHGRVHADKRKCGRGRSHEWIISRAELERVKNEGLLPVPKH